MQVQLTWLEEKTNTYREVNSDVPIALGRIFSQMPSVLNDREVCRIVIDDSAIEDYHALIDLNRGRLVIKEVSRGGTLILNGKFSPGGPLTDGDLIQLFSYEIAVKIIDGENNAATECDRIVGFLFPRRCGRTSPQNCPHCDAALNETPYFLDSQRSLYPGYGTYSSGGSLDSFTGGSELSIWDFSEADVVYFESTGADFEQNMGAS